MCVENVSEKRVLTEEEIEKIIKASDNVNNFLPDLKLINSMLAQHSKAIDEEKEARIKEDDEIKYNYRNRFDKIDNCLIVINTEMKKVEKSNNEIKIKLPETIAGAFKGQIKFLKGLLFSLLGCTVFLFIVMTWDKALEIIKNIF